MTPRDFCYWLQGYMELAALHGENELTGHQVRVIKEHLQLVFEKVTPGVVEPAWQGGGVLQWLKDNPPASC